MDGSKMADSKLLDVFLDTSKLRLLAPFLKGVYTVAEVAEMAGVSAGALGYWVKRFLAWGLLEEVTEGRPAKYRAVSKEFLFDATRDLPLEAVLARWDEAIANRLIRGLLHEHQRISDDWVLRVGLTDDTDDALLIRELLPAWAMDDRQRQGPELPLNAWGVIELSRQDAENLRRVLEQTVTEFFERTANDESSDKYVFHIGLVRESRPD